MLKRARLFGRLSPRWLKLATCRELGAAADLPSLKELLRAGWVEGLVEMARAWPPAQRTRLCAHLLEGGWEAAEVLLAEEDWRVAAAWSVLQQRPTRLEELVTRFPPADRAARSLLLLFAGRLDAYEELDFDRRYLSEALETAPPAVRTLLLRHTASLGRADLVSHQSVPWCQLEWPEFEARLQLLGDDLDRILPELRADQAARAMELRGVQGLPDPATVRNWLSVPAELGRQRADYACANRVARQRPDRLEVSDWDGNSTVLPEKKVVDVVFSPDGTRVAVDRGGVVVLYQGSTWLNAWNRVELFCFDPDGNLAVVERNGVLGSLWTPAVEESAVPWVSPHRVMSMASRGVQVALGLESGEIGVWWSENPNFPYLFPGYHEQPVILTVFLGRDKLLTGTRREIFLWQVGPCPGQLSRLQVVARGEFASFQSAQNRLVVAGADGVLGWSLDEPSRVETLKIWPVEQVATSGLRMFASDPQGQVWCGSKSLGHHGMGIRGLFPSRDELIVLGRREAIRLSLRQNLIDLPLRELRRLKGDDEGFLSRLFDHMHRFSITLGEETVTRDEDILL